MHIPVLLNETIEALDPKPNDNFIDGTFGWGGHSLAILDKIAPKGKVLGIERDCQSLAALPRKIKDHPRLVIANDSYVNLEAIAQSNNFENIKGVLLDLGMSSWHIDESKKGFSFSKNEPLDMRYDAGRQIDAAQIINEWPEGGLEKIFKNFGQEPKSKKIAQAIGAARQTRTIDTTAQLAAIVAKVAPRGGIKSLARIFQSLRIAVNCELESVKNGIDAGFRILPAGGRLAVIAFHSLEDGIVKDKFRELAESGKAKLIFKKPVVAKPQEIAKNPRARSAKLRAVEKI